MPTFEVLVNRIPGCVANANGNGSLNAILSWRGEASRGVDAPFTLHLGGFQGDTDELVRWAVPAVGVGDEITIRIADDAESDAPAERESLDPERVLTEQQAYVRRMAAEWGWVIQELPALP